MNATKLRLKACPRCGGDQSLGHESHPKGYIEVWSCIQCSHQVEGEIIPHMATMGARTGRLSV